MMRAMEAFETPFCRNVRMSSSSPSSFDLPRALAAGIRPTGQDPARVALVCQQGRPAPGDAPTQQRRIPSRPVRLLDERQQGPRAPEPQRRPGQSGQLSQSGDQCRHLVEHRLHGGSSGAAQTRRLSHPRQRSCPRLANALRASECLRPFSLRRRGGAAVQGTTTVAGSRRQDPLTSKIVPLLSEAQQGGVRGDLHGQGVRSSWKPSRAGCVLGRARAGRYAGGLAAGPAGTFDAPLGLSGGGAVGQGNRLPVPPGRRHRHHHSLGRADVQHLLELGAVRAATDSRADPSRFGCSPGTGPQGRPPADQPQRSSGCDRQAPPQGPKSWH